jgi:hypothetical protein
MFSLVLKSRGGADVAFRQAQMDVCSLRASFPSWISDHPHQTHTLWQLFLGRRTTTYERFVHPLFKTQNNGGILIGNSGFITLMGSHLSSLATERQIGDL